MRQFSFFLMFFFAFGAFASESAAQETEIRVVDEVIAQVNEGVITLSRVKKEMKNIADQTVTEGKTREEADRMVEEKKGELIANLINEELLMQRSKELRMDSEVEAMVNGRALEIMKQYNLKTLDELYKAMETQGVNPADVREAWRRQATRDLVVQQDLHRKLYWEATPADVKAYYEKNKAKFTRPETVSVSEIFLGYAGRDEATVKAKGKELVAQLRAGGDFAKLATENSDPGQFTQGQGKVEKVLVSELNAVVAGPLKDVRVGGYTDPIEIAELGVIILRVDDRQSASSDSEFNENAVRTALLQEKIPAAYKKYMANLRQDSYIKISEEYRPLVAPILFAEERTEKTAVN